MVVLVSAIAFFFLITGLILIHEAGHFIAARRAGVEVEEFGFGLPPRAKTLFRWRGTEFSVNWIPFGGFVRLKGESATDVQERRQPGSFMRAGIVARCIILIAGVAMNLLLAMLIFLYGFSFGRWIPTFMTLEAMEQAAVRGDILLELGVVIDEVLESGPARSAGIPAGSVLRSVDGETVRHPAEVVDIQRGKQTVTYVFSEPGKEEETRTVRVSVEDGKTGVYLRAVPLEVSAPRRSLFPALALSLRETKVVTSQTVLGIAHLFGSLARRGVVPEGVTGIVGIAQLTYTSVQEGFAVYLRLVALLSLSLAVLNILPFPALDGGRLLFVLSELFIRPGSRRVELISNTVGFGVLLFVIIVVTLYDVFRLFD